MVDCRQVGTIYKKAVRYEHFSIHVGNELAGSTIPTQDLVSGEESSHFPIPALFLRLLTLCHPPGRRG